MSEKYACGGNARRRSGDNEHRGGAAVCSKYGIQAHNPNPPDLSTGWETVYYTLNCSTSIEPGSIHE